MAPKSKKVKEKMTETLSPILDEIPKPITTFDMSDGNKLAENYDKCVGEIRSQMATHTDMKFTFVPEIGRELVVPITPGKDDTKRGQYVIRLTCNGTDLQLVGSKYQNWFRGIVTSNGSRYEIDSISPKVMQRSKSLHTDGMYPKLIDGGVVNVVAGYQQLYNSFYTLSREVRHTGRDKAAIAVFLVMLYEAPRLQPVLQMCRAGLAQQMDFQVGEERKGMINNWCNDSRDLYDEKGSSSFNRRDGKRKVVVSGDSSGVVLKAACNLRILCRSEWDKWLEKQSKAVKSKCV